MRAPLVATLLMLPALSAQAQEFGIFALEFSRHETPLQGGTTLESNGLGLRYSERSALPFTLSMALGYERSRHRDDPVSLGFEPDGYYAAITLDAASPQWQGLQGGLTLDYGYHWSEESVGQQRLELDWHQSEARLWLALRLGSRARLHGCIAALNIDGSQGLIGATPSQLDFKAAQRSGYCGGVELETGDGGYIGLELESRHQKGALLYFGRRYGD